MRGRKKGFKHSEATKEKMRHPHKKAEAQEIVEEIIKEEEKKR